MIYLDNAATTFVFPEVAQKIFLSLSDPQKMGNPSSIHALGVLAAKEIITAQEKIAGVLRCQKEEILFTSGGTESINLAIQGFCLANLKPEQVILTTKTEHKASLESLAFLQSLGWKVEYVSVDAWGHIDLQELEDLLTPKVGLISLTWINNETGTILPLQEIIKLRDKVSSRIKIHIDGVQAVGKVDINLAQSKIDLLSFSAHKFHGPKGIGALFIRRNTKLQALLRGGEQQGGLRAGTQAPYLCGAMTEALGKQSQNIVANWEYFSQLKRKFISQLDLQQAQILSAENAFPGIVLVSFGGFKGEVMIHALAEYGIYASTGSACTSKNFSRVSHVLQAQKIESVIAQSAVRFSFGQENTMEEMEKVGDAIHQIYKKYSPRGVVWNQPLKTK